MEDGDNEIENGNIRKALAGCGYPRWGVDPVEKKLADNKEQGRNKKKKLVEKEETNKGMVVLPYVQGLSERVERIMRKNPISVAMKPHKTLRNILAHHKDKGEPKEGVFSIDCKNCCKKYVGETKRLLAQRVNGPVTLGLRLVPNHL